MYKGLSVKQWQSKETVEMSKGMASVLLSDLEKGTMYRVTVKAANDFGESGQSRELWFRTLDGEVEIRKT